MELDPDLVDQEVIDEVEDPEDSNRLEFPCDNCGAETTWDPDADAMSCKYCGHVVPVPRAEGTIVERALEDVGDAARGMGLELRVARCSNCGARVTFGESETVGECVYCGSSNVLAQEANRNAIRPESLVPLDVGRADVEQNFHKWLGKLWFRPNEVKNTKRFDAIGIYVPFWTFDCHVHSDWSADAGYYYWVTQTYVMMVNGKPTIQTRRVRKVRWVPAWGDRDDDYDDHLVIASKGLPPETMKELGGFFTTGLVPYRPEYLAGWRAEEYQVDLETGWDTGRADIEAYQKVKCAGDIPGDTHRALRVQNRISDVRWKHVLLPVWSLQYKYNAKTYTVLIHGQTGQVAGKAPYSWVKILLFVLAVIFGVLLLILIAGGFAAIAAVAS